jgi:DNA (cytosine-5)-methyltransferase 1
MKKRSFLTVTDQFCGAGGSSLGATAVPDINVYLAMNHWALAIETHNTNFPDTYHDMSDISAVDPRRYPSTDILITSPECTNHSLAKGVKRRQKQLHLWEKDVIDPSAERSRATMWDVPRFAEVHQYNIIVTENVVDARQWLLWDAWIHAMTSLGYDYHIVYFNSMFAHLDPNTVQSLHDFAPQSRDRMYVVFWKKGNVKPNLNFNPRAYCSSCDAEVAAVQVFKSTKVVKEMGGRWGRYKDQYTYRCPKCARDIEPFYFAAFNAIDWSLPAERIGSRKRPLKSKTIQRIEEGLRRFAGQHLTVELGYSHATNNRSRPLSASLLTQSTRQSQALLIQMAYGNQQDCARPVSEPMFTQTTAESVSLAMPFLSVQYSPGYNKPVTDAMASVTTQDHHALVSPFMVEFHNNQDARGLDEPISTIATSGAHHGVVMPAPFLTSYYGSNGNQRTVDEPLGALTATDRHGVVMPFMLGYANGDGPARDVTEPLRTLHTGNGQGLVQPESAVAVDDCYFRMLQPHEVGRGMAFPESYVVLGTKRDQVKQYGNAVTPVVMRMILERCAATLR